MVSLTPSGAGVAKTMTSGTGNGLGSTGIPELCFWWWLCEPDFARAVWGSMVTAAAGTGLAAPASPACGGSGGLGAAPACAGSRLEAEKHWLGNYWLCGQDPALLSSNRPRLS